MAKRPSGSPKTKTAPQKSPPAAVPDSLSSNSSSRTFPIVGVGCSAGGLEALESFFHGVPADCGMAFVVVQHLDPRYVSNLPELLGRGTELSVVEVGNRMPVEPGHVYVIPPNKELSLLHGVLHLLDPASHSGLRLPVDFFFRSLAEDCQEQAIGVILSGMGSDGMLGLRAIKEKGGFSLVEDPVEAKSDGMPRSAIEAGLADVIGPTAELFGQIVAFLQQAQRRPAIVDPVAPTMLSALEKIIILLRDRCGADFSDYKTSTLYRRIERRTALHHLQGIAAYVSFLRENPQELDLLFKELLIGVTNFFRDPPVWDILRDKGFPALFALYPHGQALRAWVPACSSGEEAYSLAMVFREALETCKPEGRFTLQVYATDIDADAIDKARRGFFPGNIAVDVTPDRLARFFVSDEGGWRIGKDIRDMVVFAPQNIFTDPPFTKLDILSCRNLLIYFGQTLQKKLLPLFHYALNRDGLLILGNAETVGQYAENFESIDGKTRIFRRLDQASLQAQLEFPDRLISTGNVVAVAETTAARGNLEVLADHLIQQNFAPPAVLVNSEGDILYISGRTGKYLEPAAGKVNFNLHAMARPGLREALTGVIRNAQRQTQPVRLNGLVIGTNGGSQTVDVVVQGINAPDSLRGRVLVVFYDVAQPPPARKSRRRDAANSLELELQQTREALRVAHEEMQTSIEEYKSANEELQSTNEELTTSKEEMQSLNEELQTVNAELQSKVDELTGVRNDMTNLLNSTEVATVFLDNKLKLRRFTVHATRLFKLIPSDIGRPLSDIASELDYPRLIDDAGEVLRTLVYHEQEVVAHDNHWYRVRIMPYRTLENLIDGVVITFIDVSERVCAQRDIQTSLDAMLRLRDLTLKFVQGGEMPDFLGDIVEAAMAITQADFGTIQLVDPPTGDLQIVAHRGELPDWWLDFWRTVNAGKGSCGAALQRNERMIIEDVEQSPVFVGTPALEIQLRAGIRAVQSTPLVSRAGQPIGMFSTHYRQRRRPDDRALALLDILARSAADMIDQRQVEVGLQKRQAHLQLLVDQFPKALAMFDTRTRYLALSQRWRDRFSLGDKDVRGRSHEQVCPACPEPWRAAFQRVLTGEAVGPDEVPEELPDGTRTPLRWEMQPWRGADGAIAGVIIVGEEVAGNGKHAAPPGQQTSSDADVEEQP
jgi:two-component system CheB/CheR fusion protein